LFEHAKNNPTLKARESLQKPTYTQLIA
jgi:hypothetical protein